MKILKYIITGLFLILFVVFAIENGQTVDINFFTLYLAKIPLVVALVIFFVLGLGLGVVMNIYRNFLNNMKIKSLAKKVNKK